MKKYHLELTEQEITVIIQALAEAPFRVSAPVIEAIQTQLPKKEDKE